MAKRVAMISVHECPLAASEGKERGGINVYVYELSKALSKHGISVDMYTRMQDTVNPAIVRINDHARVIHIPAGPKTHIPKQDVVHHLDEFTRNLTSYIETEQIRYDAIHAHYYYSGMVATKIPNRPPVLMTFHTLGLLKQLTQTTDPKDDIDTRIAMEKELVQSVDRILATSANEVSYLTALYNANPKNIVTVPPGVDTTLFTNIPKDQAKRTIGADSNHRIILSVGRIDPVKGFDVLLYALKLLVQSAPELTSNVCVWIVGGEVEELRHQWNAEQVKLEKLRHTLGLETTVTFIPVQSQERLPSYYNAADVLVMPSHYESFGMVALEALACGTQVIATDVTGISPLIKKFPKGHIISANNPILLAKKLAHVLSTPIEQTVDTAQSIANLDWNETAKRIAALYTR